MVLAVQDWRGYLSEWHFSVVTDDSALRCLYSMQYASSILTHWAVPLQAFDFTVVHTSAHRNALPDLLSRLFAFEQQESLYAQSSLAHICQNVPDNPALNDTAPSHDYSLSMDAMHKLQPAMRDREFLPVPCTLVPPIV